MKGTVFDIQHYAIYDGPGIRTTVFLKGCPLRCAWCHNPESQRLEPQISYFREHCLKCGTCVKICPNNAIRLTREGIIRNEKLCVVCGRCEVCPNQAMEKIGKDMSVEEIVARDKLFYDNSGGGVTISGGEPTAQAVFLIELLSELKRQSVHTAIETCGFFKENLIDELVNLVNLFLYDIKHIDPKIHKKFTGVSNKRILSNFASIVSRVGSKRVISRIPIIPRVNTDLKTIDGITSFLRQVNYSGPVHLMPYNKLAKTKYEKIGKGKLYKNMGDLSEDNLQAIIKRIERHSFTVVCNR